MQIIILFVNHFVIRDVLRRCSKTPPTDQSNCIISKSYGLNIIIMSTGVLHTELTEDYDEADMNRYTSIEL